MALGSALALSFLSYAPDSRADNYVGPVGYAVSNVLIQSFGFAAYIFPVLLLAASVALFARFYTTVSPVRVVGGLSLLVVLAVALGLYRADAPPETAGGWIGGFLATLMGHAFGVIGSSVILVALALLIFIMLTGLPPSHLAHVLVEATGARTASLFAVLRERLASVAAVATSWLEKFPSISQRRSARGEPAPFAYEDPMVFGGEEAAVEPVAALPLIQITGDRNGSKPTAEKKPAKAQQEEFIFEVDDSDYKLPPVALLGKSDGTRDYGDEKVLITQSKVLEQKLATFGVSGRVTAVRPGPIITTFEFEPEAGIKVSRVVNLCDDLTMAMRAHSVRIVAPIPGKNVVGIEVSNRTRETVGLRDLIDSEEFGAQPSLLTLAVGRDTTGRAVYADLAKMPHLLMAGATGAGKSVSLNVMILSILYKASPRDVRFIMIDPKMLELALYEGIPHLLVPVVTDVKKATAALANVMREMDRRFDLLKDMGVRNIDDYNARLEEEGYGEDADEDAEYEEEEYEEEYEEAELEASDDGEEDEEYGEEYEEDEGLQHEHLPRLVVIVDELADLMMTVGREVEGSITRLAQKARAAGIHLIIATQRPSVDVITGLIKANFPTRISFQVTARPDSRTILDSIGAERLLGNGDMLYSAPGSSSISRLHGALVGDREIRAIVDFLKKQGDPEYHMELLALPQDDAEEDSDEEFFDDLYDRAVDLITEHGQGSTSWLQRKLSIGYNRAARIMEHMEREGVVGPADGSRPRKVIAQALPG